MSQTQLALSVVCLAWVLGGLFVGVPLLRALDTKMREDGFDQRGSAYRHEWLKYQAHKPTYYVRAFVLWPKLLWAVWNVTNDKKRNRV